MKVTIKAKVGYRVRAGYNRTTGEKIAYVYDGEETLMRAKYISSGEFCAEIGQNEAFHICEIFTTVKGNTFAYGRDEEIDEDYIAKFEEGEQV